MNWDMAYLMRVATGYWPAAALIAAVELGVFEALAGGAELDSSDLAPKLQADPRALTELLDALAALEALDRTPAGAYRIAPGAADLLDPARPGSKVEALRYNRDLYPLWGKLGDAVRAGAPVIPPAAHLGADPGRTRRFALGMHSRALGLAPLLLPVFRCPPEDSDGTFRLLDIGAGPGTFSRLLAEGDARLWVVQLDLAPVLAVARELAADSPAAGRISFQPADYRSDSFAGPMDGALYCGALHQESPETAAALFRKIVGVLRPGGHIWVVDLMTAPGRRGPLMAHLFSLNMLLTSSRGRVFAEDDVAGLLTDSGFVNPAVRRCEPAPYSVIEARAP